MSINWSLGHINLVVVCRLFTHLRFHRASHPGLYSPGPAHSHHPSSLSVHYACACGCKCAYRIPNKPLKRHTSFALMECQSLGFTYRRIHRASPLVSSHPVSPIHSTRPVSLSIMHVHRRATHLDTVPAIRFAVT